MWRRAALAGLAILSLFLTFVSPKLTLRHSGTPWATARWSLFVFVCVIATVYIVLMLIRDLRGRGLPLETVGWPLFLVGGLHRIIRYPESGDTLDLAIGSTGLILGVYGIIQVVRKLRYGPPPASNPDNIPSL